MAGGVPVGHKPLQTADAHGLTLNRVGAVLFTLLLLGADPPADGGHGASHGDNVIGPFKVPLCHAGNELGDLLGQPATQGFLRQFRQRMASRMASASV